jgi:hypothetical protein
VGRLNSLAPAVQGLDETIDFIALPQDIRNYLFLMNFIWTHIDSLRTLHTSVSIVVSFHFIIFTVVWKAPWNLWITPTNLLNRRKMLVSLWTDHWYSWWNNSQQKMDMEAGRGIIAGAEFKSNAVEERFVECRSVPL